MFEIIFWEFFKNLAIYFDHRLGVGEFEFLRLTLPGRLAAEDQTSPLFHGKQTQADSFKDY